MHTPQRRQRLCELRVDDDLARYIILVPKQPEDAWIQEQHMDSSDAILSEHENAERETSKATSAQPTTTMTTTTTKILPRPDAIPSPNNEADSQTDVSEMGGNPMLTTSSQR